jgi:hypothetical protein
VVLLLGYTLTCSHGFTGIGIREWLGLGLGLALRFHLTPHRDRVIRTARKLAAPRGHDRVIRAVNLALLVGMTWCVPSGILVRGQPVKRLPPGVKIRPGLHLGNIGPENLGLTSMFQAVNPNRMNPGFHLAGVPRHRPGSRPPKMSDYVTMTVSWARHALRWV